VAKADLRGIYDFIAHDSRFYAKKVAQEITEKTDILESHPFIGCVVAEIGDENIREISLYAYRIIYQLMDEQVFILAIAHKRQNLKNITPVS
jgi:plasmid stabilization system protein ParE